jgi:hypothetical protein
MRFIELYRMVLRQKVRLHIEENIKYSTKEERRNFCFCEKQIINFKNLKCSKCLFKGKSMLSEYILTGMVKEDNDYKIIKGKWS